MNTLRIACLSLALAGCASSPDATTSPPPPPAPAPASASDNPAIISSGTCAHINGRIECMALPSTPASAAR